MDGIHDLGGMAGFGPVSVEPNETVFHEAWEKLAYALNALGIVRLGSYNIDIGNDGNNAGESKTIRIGTKGDQTRTFIAGINGKTVSGTGTPVVVNDKGQLGTASAVAATKTAAPKAATNRRFARMEATMKRQQRQIERQGKEIRALRAQR